MEIFVGNLTFKQWFSGCIIINDKTPYSHKYMHTVSHVDQHLVQLLMDQHLQSQCEQEGQCAD